MTSAASYIGFRYPVEIISHGVWLYYRFALSLRDVSELMLARGVIVSHETIRQWTRKFGQNYANGLRRRRRRPGDTWHLDEMVVKINGVQHYLWRAVDGAELYDLSDAQTAEALKFDIRWKVACGRSLIEMSFDPSTLVYWRRRIAASKRPDRVFDAVAEVIAQTGVWRGRRKRCVDSTARRAGLFGGGSSPGRKRVRCGG